MLKQIKRYAKRCDMEDAIICNQVLLRGVLSEPPHFSHENRGERFDQFSLEVRRLSGEKEKIYRQIALDDPALQNLSPGTEEMLDMLKWRGIPHAIATASMPENVDFYFDTLGIGRWFDREHVFFDEAGLPGKPDPAIYIMALKMLPLPRDIYEVCFVVALMPAAVASALVSRLYGGDGEFASQSVVVTTLLALATVPLWILLI